MLGKIFDTAIAETTSLEDAESNPSRDSHIRNVVSTVNLLDNDQCLCLEIIASTLGPMAKFQPRRFAAIVLRIKDAIATTTCLVFRTGKLVVVGALSRYHALYAAQLYRIMIEQVVVPYKDPDTERIILSNLEGRTKFDRWGIWNIVASVNIGCRPDLKLLTELLGDVTAWNPELFPGLKLLVWLRPKALCRCNSRKKNKSCACNSRALLFDTGQVVMTGCRVMSDINLTKHRIQTLMEDEDFHEKDAQLPKHQRFEARRQKILRSSFVETMAPTEKQREKRQRNENDADGKMIMRKFKFQFTTPQVDEPFVQACITGQVANVAFMLPFCGKYVDEALRQLHNMSPEDVNPEVLSLLEKTLT